MPTNASQRLVASPNGVQDLAVDLVAVEVTQLPDPCLLEVILEVGNDLPACFIEGFLSGFSDLSDFYKTHLAVHNFR